MKKVQLMRVVLLSIFLLTGHKTIFAQTVTGRILTEDSQPFEYVRIKLMKLDSSVITGIYTDVDGRFSFEKITFGDYLLEASYAGFSTLYLNFTVKQNQKEVQLGDLELVVDKTLELEGVIAAGSLDVLKAGIDKKVYKTTDDLSTRGGSVQDVLSNIPSIEVDQDGNISLRGDANVVILIDGRPSALALGDGQNLLDALPANSVERIEVVTNPSARYDPDGTSGIINIVLKKNQRKGVNGIVSLSAATGNRYEVNAGISYRNKEWNFYTNYSLNYYEGFRNYNNELYREVTSDSSILLLQDREGTDLKENHTIVLGADYFFNDRSSIAISATGSLGRRERTSDLDNFLYQYTDPLQVIDSWERNAVDPRENQNYDVNLNYKYELKEDKGEFSINANHSRGTEFIQGFYEEIYHWSNGTESNQSNLNQQLENNESKGTYTFQSDFNYIFKKIAGRMEVGLKSILGFENISTYSETEDTLSGFYYEDTLANFDYAFNNEVHSVYGIFGQELGKFKYQLGVRGEYAVQAPNLISQGEKYFKTYANLFPSGHLKYVLNDKNEFSLSYSKRINRPRSHHLNPFTSYADPLNLRQGNPLLDPEYINSFDLGYSFIGKKVIVTASVFHRVTKDVINRVKIYRDDNTAILTRDNIDESIITGSELILIVKPTKWWKNTISGNVNHTEYVDSDPQTDWNNSGVNWSVKYAGTVDFWKKTASVQVNWNYHAPRITPQGVFQRQPGVTLSLEKRLLDKRLSVNAKVTDLFNVMSAKGEMEQVGIRQNFEYKWLTRRYYLTLTYRFGGMDNKLKIPKSGGGGSDD